MTNLVQRIRFDAARCEVSYSKGIATNIEEAADEIERLRAALLKMRHALETIANCGQSSEPDHWKFRVMARKIATDALEEKP